ncbi:MAG: hemolysin III family protein [Neomegalonema sp.]|nr:hemolysin III family protein [Neomegalonema sp.]
MGALIKTALKVLTEKATMTEQSRLDRYAAAFGPAMGPSLSAANSAAAEAPDDGHEYTRNERVADAIVHIVSIVFGIAGVSALLTLSAIYNDAATIASIAIYGVGLITVFITSAAYHMIDAPEWKNTLRRLDHAAIFIKIAGSYTPFAVVSIGGGWGVLLLSVVWAIAVIGAPLKLFAPDKIERVTIALYLLQGWMLLFAIGPLKLSTAALTLILIGGGLYTIGVIFHLWRNLPFHNAIWHVFVLAGSCCMYAAVLAGITLA